MLTYFYRMAERMEKLLEAVLEMNRKYDLILEKLERMENLMKEVD